MPENVPGALPEKLAVQGQSEPKAIRAAPGTSDMLGRPALLLA